MQKNEYSFFLVAGKDGISTRYAFGNPLDVAGMVLAMMEKNEEIAIIIKDAVENYEANLELKKQPIPNTGIPKRVRNDNFGLTTHLLLP